MGLFSCLFGGVVMRSGDRCRVKKVLGHWVVIHDPSGALMWAGLVWVDAIVYATRGKK